MEYVLLLAFLELFSASISYFIIKNEMNYIINQLGIRGYKVNKEMAVDTIDILDQEDLTTKVNKLKMLIPFYNIIYAKRILDKETKKQIDRLKQDQLITNMSIEESKYFDKIKNGEYRFLYILNKNYYDSIDKEIVTDTSYRYNKPVIEKLNIQYTSTEIDSLSNVFEGQYLLGKVGDKNIAILGAYDVDLAAKLPRLIGHIDNESFEVLPKCNYGSEEFETYTYKLPSNNKRFLEIQKNIFIARKMIEIKEQEKCTSQIEPKKLVK